ncbi:MAG TPA: hypothetical protein VHG91_21540 [Longimicrobium sp.]|nr:hypothetical protein [Longimicrobium sp.]
MPPMWRYGNDYGPRRDRYDAEYRGRESHGRYGGGYDRGYAGRVGYDRAYGGGGGYDRGYRRGGGWDAGYGDVPNGGYGTGDGQDFPYDATGWAPFTLSPLAWDPVLGWAGWGPGTGYVPMGYPGRYPRDEPRVPPRQSPLYGRGGDRALERWAQRYGYEFERTIRPRR